MPIHILDCATMSPWFPRWHLRTPCLLVETDQGLVLVDTGLGLHDYEHPSRMVQFFSLDFGIHRDPGQAAVRQIAKLGYSPELVRHIVLTHLHFDHAGGLPDFPDAQVHVHRWEYEAMRHTRGHCGVAIQEGEGWLFQGGDALPTNAEFDLLPEWLYPLVIGTHVPRLRAWSISHPEVRLLAGHMWHE